MAQAHRDQNRIPDLLGVSNADGSTPVEIYADPSTHELLVQATTTITGVATAANQTNGSQKTQIVDGSGNVISSTTNALWVNVKNTSLAVTGTFWQTTQPVSGTVAVTNADLTTIAGAVSATHMQCDVLTLPAITATNLDIRDLTSASDSVAAVCTNAGTFAVQAAGDVAAGTTDSGNPVKVGGKYSSTQPTLTDGQRGDLYLGPRNALAVFLKAGANATSDVAFLADNADDVAVNTTAAKFAVVSRGTVFDGTTWDRQMGDSTNGTLVNLGTNNDVTVTNAGTFAVQAVCTNAGTFAVQTTLAAETTKVIGTINVAASQTIAVTSAVAANLNCTEASAATIATSLGNIDNAVDGNYLNVNMNVAGTDVASNAGTLNAQTVRVTIATDDEVNNLLGTIDADTGNIAKSINGASAPTIDSYAHIAINLAAGANQSLVAAPGANKQIWVYGFGFTVNAAGTVSFQDEDDTAISGIMNIAALSGMIVNPSGNFSMPIWKLVTNKALEVDIVTSELDGWLDYSVVSV